MPDWVIPLVGVVFSIAVGVGTYIVIFVTVKNKTDSQGVEIAELKEIVKDQNTKSVDFYISIGEKFGEVKATQADLNTKFSSKPTMEAVRSEFVSKELFKAMEKHFDMRFQNIENGLKKILDKLEKEN